ncbi:MAG: DUF3866 domain-containing protein [Firmicutes bacterium HGW-Firmicutes-12]|nr:MAG: DUF3866 domain-containing protein [Firmicutes bacterium HGW-Firmicutes-12]
MINRKIGIVKEIIPIDEDLLEVVVTVEGLQAKAYAYPLMTGEVRVGDKVLLNTTAVDLGLGSGGYHFIMAVLNSLRVEDVAENKIKSKAGHIIKLRYTPFQVKLLSIEEEESHWHTEMAQAEGLSGIPVVVGSLHSMLIPCVCGIKAQEADLRIAYVMTDGGALPIGFSRAVKALKEKGLICGTVTTGHAYGGDCEAVNVYSGILAADKVLKAQIIVVMMGPGIVGTGTRWGHTGLELGGIVNCICSLGGRSYSIPRISFAELRERHRGISHHTLTSLGRVALASTNLVLPELDEGQKKIVLNQLQGEEFKKHQLVWERGDEGIELAKEMNLQLSHMGRSFHEDPQFFLASSAAGKAAAKAIFFIK